MVNNAARQPAIPTQNVIIIRRELLHASIETIESLMDLLELLVDLFEPLVDQLEPQIDMTEPFVYFALEAVDSIVIPILSHCHCLHGCRS